MKRKVKPQNKIVKEIVQDISTLRTLHSVFDTLVGIDTKELTTVERRIFQYGMVANYLTKDHLGVVRRVKRTS